MEVLHPGEIFAGHRIEALLARGGMGHVYRAQRIGAGGAVALKVLAPERAAEESCRERFRREVELSASLEHPHVVPILEAGECEGRLFLVMQLVAGGDLATILADEQRLDPGRAVALVGQVASALDAAHARNVVHGDVKPANVLVAGVSPHEHAYLTDFGVAVDGAVAGDGARSVAGTLDYLAPEALRGEPRTASTDVYALGCVLYELLVGNVPFPRLRDEDRTAAHLHERPAPLRDTVAELPLALETVVSKALAKHPAMRFGSAGELARAAAAAAGSPRKAHHDGAAAAVPAGIPAAVSPIVGRERDLDALAAVLAGGAARLVTLTGVAGTGKTRLALELARELSGSFRDGAVFVDLSAVTNASEVLPAVAAAVELNVEHDELLAERLTDHLRQRHHLLVLDNFEHVVEAAGVVARLVREAPEIRVVVTSRTPLRVEDERMYAVPPLAVPDGEAVSVADLCRSGSGMLFVSRAEAAGARPITDADAATIGEICRRLDGLPLALELAAARSGMLALEDLLHRLRRPLDLLASRTDGRPTRHQTLRAAIAWSHDALPPAQRMLLARLSVFRGGFTPDAVERVCGDDGLDVRPALAALLDNSLVAPALSARDAHRLSLLEAVREFAAEQLRARREEAKLREAHARYFLELAEQTVDHLGRPRVADLQTRRARAPERGRPAHWIEALVSEDANLRAAIEWARETCTCELELRFVAALWRYWQIRGEFHDALAAAQAALKRCEGADEALLARALLAASGLTAHTGDLETCGWLLERLLAISPAALEPEVRFAVLSEHGNYLYERGRLHEAIAQTAAAADLAREHLNEWQLAEVLGNLGLYCFLAGDLARGERLLDQAAAVNRARDDDFNLGPNLINLASVHLAKGDPDAARRCAAEALQRGVAYGAMSDVPYYLEGLAAAALAADDAARALLFAAAAEQASADNRVVLQDFEASRLSTTIREARSAVPAERSEALLAAGRGMSVEQLTALAAEGGARRAAPMATQA